MQISKLIKSVFNYAAWLVVVWAFFEVSFSIQAAPFKLTDFAFISHKLNMPLSMLPGAASFFLAQFFLHLVLILIISVTVMGWLKRWPHLQSKFLTLIIAAWLVSINWLLFANAVYYPNSKFADLVTLFFPSMMLKWAGFYGLSALAMVAVLLAFWGYARCLTWRMSGSVFLSGLSLIAFNQFYSPTNIPVDAGSALKPNIIIIGMDSVRPDFLHFFGGKSATPFINKFLKQATVFDNATTPLARTFPSWSSLLLSQYPVVSGIRTDLIDTAHLSLSQSLPMLLQQTGYETVYATDEARFSNMDERFGFQHLLTPPMGLNDFLLGTINDFPLSNLVINTKVGQWLFPFSYANRPVFATYDPSTFNLRLKNFLDKKRTQPLFMAVHFCLPHHPYLWRDALPVTEQGFNHRYTASLTRVDQQVGDLYATLQQSHALDHAIVILLSDHGEALGLAGDRITSANYFVASSKVKQYPAFYPPSIDDEAVDQSAGHGTDVLSFSQYRTLLAWQASGLAQTFTHQTVKGPASLLDVKPTLLSFLKLKNQSVGISLWPQLLGVTKSIPTSRVMYFESDYSPSAVRTVYPEARDVVLEGVNLFHLDPITTRLTVRPEMLAKIIKSKQLAVRQGDWVLAYYPQSANKLITVLVNSKTKTWTTDVASTFAQQAPLLEMTKELDGFFRRSGAL